MDDLISRAAAIDAARDWYEGLICGSFKGLEKQLRALPSAQPDLCDGCDRYGASCVGEGCGKLEMPEVAKDINVPINDTISRQSAIDAVNNIMPTKEGFLEPSEVLCELMQLPSAQAESTRTFVELVVEYPDPELCTYKKYRGKPYYSIKYIENGETYVGYGTYNPEVLSQYLKEYFISSAQPEITPDGTLNVSIDADIANVGRILLSQAGTQRGGLYYKDEQPEIIHCAECEWLQCNMRQDGTLPKGVDEFECRHWCGYCDPMDFCSHAERRTDG